MRDLDFYGTRDPGKGTGRRCEWCTKLLHYCECDPVEGAGELWLDFSDDCEDGDSERCINCGQWHSSKECV